MNYYVCSVPTCTRRRNPESHRVDEVAHEGSNERENLTNLCRGHHHHHGVHRGRIKVTGRSPHQLVWCLGMDEAGNAQWVVQGRRIVSPRAS